MLELGSYAWAAVLGCPLLQVFLVEFRINDHNKTTKILFIYEDDALGRHILKMVNISKFDIQNS